jgi:CBS domain-containing protein
LLANGLSLYLPSVEKILAEMSLPKNQQQDFQKITEGLKKLKVGDIMNREPIVFFEDTTYQQMVRVLTEHHRVTLVPVVDKEGMLRGVISKFDLLKIFSPQFDTPEKK